jgi:LysR family transcriptional regulator, glycine cleavage system transcriptional activator
LNIFHLFVGSRMRQRLPPLNSLRLFEASARFLSFKNAAEELLLTPSAVSHGIRSLEQWLGARLFIRTARGLELTDAGARYYPVVKAALGMLVNGAEQVSDRRNGKRRLAISAAPTFASRVLVPSLARFRERRPELDVVIDTAHEHAELGAGGVDLAIRMGRGRWDGLEAHRLLGETLVPVCVPEDYRQFKDLDVDDVPLIHVTSVSEDWAHWCEATGRRAPDQARGLRFDTIYMAFEAAARGLGVAMGRRPLVDVELSSGALVALWAPEVKCETAYWLVAPQGRATGTDVGAFRRWMTSQPIALA